MGAIASRLGAEGATVVLLDLNSGALADARGKLTRAGVECHTYKLDVTSLDAVKKCIDGIARMHGQIDVLVQSAGITGKTGIKTHDVPVDNFELVLKVNTVGIF